LTFHHQERQNEQVRSRGRTRRRSAAGEAEAAPRRGDVRFRIVDEPREEAALELASELLADDVRHLAFFFRSEDRAADAGDFLTLHGFRAGPPGDASSPVWLAVDELEARAALDRAE